MSNDGALHSTIPGSTPAQLHLVVRSDNSLAWHYIDASGALVLLDSSDTLTSEYPGNLAPPMDVLLRIVNTTTKPITIEVVAHGNASVEPKAPQEFIGEYTWKCRHNGGETCQCATTSGACMCGTWSVKGAPSPGGVVIPDPTFKVRWQARTKSPSPT